MILRLRQRHRRMFAVIGVLLPIGFVFGIAMRKPIPNVSLLPVELSKSQDSFTPTVWERKDLFARAPITLRLLQSSTSAGTYGISMEASRDFVKPDLLVYWVPATSNPEGVIPDEAILLGAFNSSMSLPLPSDAIAKAGALVLYSLADREVIERSKTFTAQ